MHFVDHIARVKLFYGSHIFSDSDLDTEITFIIFQTMIDTPLLVNIKGCGYPPEVACGRFFSDYETLLDKGETFPCYYSRVNPWIVIEVYNASEMMASIIASIIVPNVIFIISLSILLYWYCPYCQAKCHNYEEQIDQEMMDEEEVPEEILETQ